MHPEVDWIKDWYESTQHFGQQHEQQQSLHFGFGFGFGLDWDLTE